MTGTGGFVAGNRPEEHVAAPVVGQTWRRVTFIHWRFDPDAIGRRLPKGLTVDTVDGSAWVSMTPFQVEHLRVLGLPALPPASAFSETNVRTTAVPVTGATGCGSSPSTSAAW